MNDIFLNTIKEHNMLKDGQRVFVALSGGADSVVLLYKMKGIQEEYGLTLEALHVNHKIRGDEAYRDEKFCVELCKGLGIGVNVLRADIPALAKEKKMGTEECAREVRYEYFYKMLKQKGFDLVATAHNLNDNAETILFNMIRGSGIKGLCGIPPIRDKIIRPLINMSKQEILDFARDNSIEYVFDKTNDDKKYTRNYIRHEIIPKVLKINPQFLQTSQNMCKSLSQDDDFITSCAYKILQSADKSDDKIVFKSSDLKDLHDAVLSRVIMLCYEFLGGGGISSSNVKYVSDHIKNAKKNKWVELPKNIIIEFLYDKIIFECKNYLAHEDFCYKLQGESGEILFERSGLAIGYKIESNKQFTKNDGTVNINYDIINNDLFFRNRKTNDAFVPLGGIGERSVKKMLIDKKIPKNLRDFLPVLCCGDEVIWVFGLNRINDKFKVNTDTKKILRLFINKGGSFFESRY